MILEILAVLFIFFITVALPLVCIGAMHYIAGFPGLYRYRDRTTALPRRSAFVDRRIVTEHWVSLNWFDPSGFIGDTSCCFNAHSPFLRCAVNPDGPCQNCSCYETSPHLTQR